MGIFFKLVACFKKQLLLLLNLFFSSKLAYAKNCYLDGVRFAINPLFLIDNEEGESEENQSDGQFSVRK
jgi:hypothetical protein